MTDSENYFINILSGYINDTLVNSPQQIDIDWNEITKLSKIHNVLGIVFTMVNKYSLDVSDNCIKELKQRMLASSAFSVKQEYECSQLVKLLNDKKIRHIVSKGYVLRDYYPDKELRTMGDVDFLIDKDNQERLTDTLCENGYKVTDTYFNEVSFDKNGIHYEFHTQLLEDDLGNGIDYGEYFDNAFKKAKLREYDYTFELNNETHFIFLIAHIGKHFYNEGCGIRMIMDIAVFLKKFGSELDWKYISDECEKIKLTKLVNNVLYLCGKWFNTGNFVEIEPMSNELYDEIAKYILEAGTFGFYERNSGVKILRKNYGTSKRSSKVSKILNWFFPSSDDMRELSSWFRDKNKIYLPIAWIKRWVDAVRLKGKSVIFKAMGTIGGGNEAEKQLRLLKELGLYQSD